MQASQTVASNRNLPWLETVFSELSDDFDVFIFNDAIIRLLYLNPESTRNDDLVHRIESIIAQTLANINKQAWIKTGFEVK